MATRAFTLSDVVSGSSTVVTWTGLLNGDDGDPFTRSSIYSDRSVQVLGTVGAGGTVSLEGSNVTTPTVNGDWFIMNDPQGNALTFTTNTSGKAVLENVRHIRPRVTAGDGTTNLTVHLLLSTTARG